MDINVDDAITKYELFEALTVVIERNQQSVEMKINNKSLIVSVFEVKLKNRSEWKHW